MHQWSGRRIVTLFAILLVATSFSARGVEAGECDCCGPMVTAPAPPAPPCCIGSVDRRMAVSTAWHSVLSIPLMVKTAAAADTYAPEPSGLAPPPGRGRPVYLSISVLRI
jgi:hypothetical protein